MKTQVKPTNTGTTITSVIHDIASPMTLIRLNLDLLAEELDEIITNNSQKVNLNRYVNRAITGVDKVKNIIEISLDDSYSLNQTEIFSVKTELRNIVRIFEFRTQRLNVRLHMNVIADIKLNGLKQAFQRIISNLITNSLDAFDEPHFIQPQSKVKIHIKKINISAFYSGDFYVVTVEDNAGGIPLTIQKHLFKEQYTTKAQGKGIGLISIKQLVEKYFSGFIRCYSIKNKGTLFAIVLPIK